MPGKHVRFSKTNKVHAPPTPGSSFNELSAASPAAPLTPPNFYHPVPGPSPYAIAFSQNQPSVGYPSESRARVPVHPYLELSSVPAINYNLIDPPSSVLDHRHQHIPSRIFGEPASVPPLRNLSINSSHLPWTIKVSAPSGSYITVGDVLDAIYRTLCLNVTAADYNLLNSQDGRRAARAYEQRYRRHHNAQMYEQEKRGGMKRIDFLMGKTKFLGLSTTSRGSDMWQLSVT